MYGYYSGDNERNDYDAINEMDTENVELEVKHKSLVRAPSADFNHKILKKKHTSQFDIEKARREAKELLKIRKGEEIKDENLMFKKQNVSLFRMYCHLLESIDWLFFVLGIIGAIGAGISMPIMSYTMSDAFSDVGNTSERTGTLEEYELMLEMVEDAFDDQIKKQLIYGAISFVCNFLSVCFWSLIGNRAVYNLKKNTSQQFWLKNKAGLMQITRLNLQLKSKLSLNKLNRVLVIK